MKLLKKILFKMGKLVATPGALDALVNNSENFTKYVKRHLCGDWGDLSNYDKKQNNEAVKEEERILSSYTLKNGQKIWIITEADRSYTTILLSSEY